MKIVKINDKQQSAYANIKSSMSNDLEIAVCNVLDACGCTGNGQC